MEGLLSCDPPVFVAPGAVCREEVELKRFKDNRDCVRTQGFISQKLHRRTRKTVPLTPLGLTS